MSRATLLLRRSVPQVAYVDSVNGDDSNSGASTTQAWKSLSRLATAQFDRDVQVLLKGGQAYPGVLSFSRKVGRTGYGKSISIGAYGEGLPVVSGFLSIGNIWSLFSPGIWVADLNAATGNTTATVAERSNVGHLQAGSATFGQKRSAFSGLSVEMDFYSESPGALYVKAAANPYQSYGAISAAPNIQSLLGTASDCVIEGIEATGTGGHGWRGGPDTHNVTIRNCFINRIGGSYLTGTLRYGNGVELWKNNKDINIVGNLIGEVYDVAATCQATECFYSHEGWDDVLIDDNTIYQCSQAWEWWAVGGAAQDIVTPEVGAGFRGVSFSRNRNYDIGFGFGADTRSNPEQIAAFLSYKNEVSRNAITMQGNSFVNCNGLIMLSRQKYDGALFSAEAVFTDNSLSTAPGQALSTEYPQVAEEWAAFRLAASVSDTNTLTVAPLIAPRTRQQMLELWAS